MIQFDVLGTMGLRGAEGRELDQVLRQPKRLALLAYLVIPAPGAWHRRDTLLGVFWPDLDTSHARTSLRNALYVLRQALGDRVLRSRGDEEVSVDPARLRTDLADLKERLRGGDPGGALALYRGELLHGLFPPESDGFLPWLDAERQRLTKELAAAGTAWAQALEREGKPAEALAAARRVLEIQPDDEVAVRRVMQLSDALGDRAGGLAFFENYRGRLAREFEAQPAPETLALAERLRRPGAAVPAAAVEAAAPVRRPESVPAAPERAVGIALRTRWPLWIAAAVIVLALGALRLTRGPAGPLRLGQSAPLTSEEGLQIEPALSPNGRLMAYARGTSERMRIYVHPVTGGTPFPLTGDSVSVELMPRWSPDSYQLLFLSRNSAYVVPAVGGAPRLVAAGTEGNGSVRSAAWSPAGDSVAIVRNDSLTVRPLEGALGGGRFIGSGSQLHSCVWSPDGRWIACVSGNWISFVPGTLFGNRAPTGIVLYPAAGGPAIALTDREHEHQSPAWSADGRFLWVLSDRDGQSGEGYAIPIGKDGKASGPMYRVGLRAQSISIVEGLIAYAVYTRRANIWSVPIPGSGEFAVSLDQAKPVTAGSQIIEVLKASRDGAWLLYDSNIRGNSDIYRMVLGADSGAGRVERLTDDAREEFAGDLNPDGRVIAFHQWHDGSRRILTRRLDDGSIEEVWPGGPDQGVARWSPDGTMLAGWSHVTEQGEILVFRRNAGGGWSAPLWRLTDAQLPVWAPDGRRVAYVTLAGSVEVIPVDSGARQVLYAPRPGSNDPVATNIVWDAGRSELWFIGHEPQDSRGGIWALPVGGGQPRLVVDLRDRAGRLNGPTFTSDGRRFYFTLDERLGNIHRAELVAR